MKKITILILYISILLLPLLVYAGQTNVQSYTTSQPDTIYLDVDFETYNKNVYQRVDSNMQLPAYIKHNIGITTTSANLNNVTIDTQTTIPQNVSTYLTQKTGQNYPFLKSETYQAPINPNKTITVTDYYFLKDSTTAIVIRTNNKNKLKEAYHAARNQTYVPGVDDSGTNDENHDHGYGNDDRDEDEDDHDHGYGNDDKNEDKHNNGHKNSDRDEDEDDHDHGYGNDDKDEDDDKH